MIDIDGLFVWLRGQDLVKTLQSVKRYESSIQAISGLDAAYTELGQNGGKRRHIRSGWSASAPPLPSYIDLFGNRKCVFDLNTEVSDSALQLRVTQQGLHRSQVPRAPIDQRGLCAPDRVCSK